MPGENGTQVALPFGTEQKKTMKSYGTERKDTLSPEIKHEPSKEKKKKDSGRLLQIEKRCGRKLSR